MALSKGKQRATLIDRKAAVPASISREGEYLSAAEAAKAMSQFKVGESSAPDIKNIVQDLEHKGDAIVHEMLAALADSFVTPIDREDLQKLSKRLDDILDYTNLAARACVLFGVERPTRPMVLLADKLVELDVNPLFVLPEGYGAVAADALVRMLD